MWSITSDYLDFRQSKHIYVGESRIATKLNIEGDGSVGYEEVNTYYYHTDHLGSAQLITDYEGGIYEHIEYTPYGELWIEEKTESFDKIPFRFTGKELDEETGFVYFGARYLSPKTNRWISSDPAGSRLIDPNRRGFHFIESLNWYSYAENNPIKYRDPNGKDATAVLEFAQQAAEWSGNFAMNDSPALGPCDVVAAGGLIVAGVAGIIGGLWALGEWIDSQSKARVEPRVIPRERPRNVSIHHIATDKNSISAKTGGPWTPQFQTLFAEGGLTLDIPQNKVPVENHAGPHPQAYHEIVYSTIRNAVNLATNGLTPNSPEYKAAARTAILSSLEYLGMQCQTPGTPLNLMITKGIPMSD